MTDLPKTFTIDKGHKDPVYTMEEARRRAKVKRGEKGKVTTKDGSKP